MAFTILIAVHTVKKNPKTKVMEFKLVICLCNQSDWYW